MILTINPEITLTKLYIEDKTVMAKYLNDKDIYDCTLRLPYPYKESDAERFINSALQFEEAHSIRRNWAIRHQDHGLIGSIGLLFLDGLESHKNECAF